MFSNTLKLHAHKKHADTAVRGRPKLKDVIRFRNGSNHEQLYERSIYERTIFSKTSIENYAILNELSIELSNTSVNLFMNIVKYLDVIENKV